MISTQHASSTNANAQELWDRCLVVIKDNVSWQQFNTWFAPIKAVDCKNNVLTIQVPSQFFYEWLEEHYVELIGKTIRRVIGREARLEYRIQMDSGKKPATIDIKGNTRAKPSKDNYVDMPLKVDDPREFVNPFIIPGMKRMQIDPQLNANLNFDNFIEGECNRLARTAGVHVAQKPGTTSFNPMMIFGGTGWGKTHLVQAIGNEVRRQHPHKSVLYVSGEKFINQFIDHSQNKQINDFIHFYQLIDVLIVDDIHLFVSAPKTQDAFYAIFSHLQQNGKQIILTSDTAPKDLEGMNGRLLSRFRWGLTAEMLAPDYETRKAILEMKMHHEGLAVPDDVVQYVAYNIQSNIRDLEGAFISLFAQATLNKKEIDIDLARRVLKNFVKASFKELNIEDIQQMVCKYFGIPYDELLAKNRKQPIVEARQITMYLAKKFTKNSLKSIGEHFSGKDHTTVIHSCQKVEDLLHTDPAYRERFLELQQKVQLAAM